MSKIYLRHAVLFAALIGATAAPAFAQTDATPRQIQGLINAGQNSTALTDLHATLQAHPNSGVAWYLVAEAEDASGNASAGRTAFAKSEQIAPGLPFADPSKVAALQAHLSGAAPQAASQALLASRPAGTGISPLVIGLGLLLLVFFMFRRFMRRRMAPTIYPNNYGAGGQPPYGPGGMPYNQGGMGSGIGGSILGGLAAGAAFAGGERIIGDLTGSQDGNAFGQTPTDEPAPDRDDGLSGTPGWDNSQDNNNNFDPGNSW